MKSANALHSTPKVTRTIESFTNILASSRLPSWKALARKRDTPEGMPIAAMVVKMVAIEIAAEDVPIISGEAILARVIHNRYPDSNAITVSTNMYAAPLPTTCPTNLLHLQCHIKKAYKYSIKIFRRE